MNTLPIYNNAINPHRDIDIKSSKINGLNGATIDKKDKVDGLSFKDIINREIEKVNNRQIKADILTQDFIRGEAEDLHQVIIATEEASLSLELAIQIRNRCIEAYREINNMQL